MIILVMGLPNSGKTTLARELAKHLNAVHWNADEVRLNLNKDLTFTIKDRVEQARRMRFLCDTVTRTNTNVIADFVCPTVHTRDAFGEAFTIWVDRISEDDSRYADTRSIFEKPSKYNVRYTANMNVGDVLKVIGVFNV